MVLFIQKKTQFFSMGSQSVQPIPQLRVGQHTKLRFVNIVDFFSSSPHPYQKLQYYFNIWMTFSIEESFSALKIYFICK